MELANHWQCRTQGMIIVVRRRYCAYGEAPGEPVRFVPGLLLARCCLSPTPVSISACYRPTQTCLPNMATKAATRNITDYVVTSRPLELLDEALAKLDLLIGPAGAVAHSTERRQAQ